MLVFGSVVFVLSGILRWSIPVCIKSKLKKWDPKSFFLGGDSEHDPYFDIKALLGRGSLSRGAL